MHRPDLEALRAACVRGDSAAAARALLGAPGCLQRTGVDSTASFEAAAEALLGTLDGANTLLHYLCAGERLTLLGGLLWSLARAPPHGGQWPAQHQRARAELLAQLLARQPRLALLAGRPNAAGSSPLHEAVLSCSQQCLAVLLAALRQLLVLRQPADEPEAAAAGAAALQLLLSVQNAELLTPFELALRQRQWAAARLLAAAASGAPPMSRPQLEACSLVRSYLGLGRWQPSPSHAALASPAAAGGGDGIRLSASGATVAEAAGRLLSKLWDALGSAAAEQLEAAPSGASSSSARQRPQRADRAGPLPLRPCALQQADVLALAEAEEAAGAQPAAASRAVVRPPPGDVAAAAPAAPAAAATCNVCFEDLPAGSLGVRLPCGHVTCDDCWRGILQAACDEGAPQRAVCPQPGCGTPLPLATAASLLPAATLQRFHRLAAQRFVTTHPQAVRCCPAPACGATLHLPSPARSAAAAEAVEAAEGAQAGAAEAAAAPGAGLDAECSACAHLLCWRCGEEAHEPASCDQVRRWGEQMAALRQAAPDADRQWLAANTKRCPRCQAHIQKHGGCLHMTCSSCGLHFCWQCGQEWRLHSVETGGFYWCSRQQQADLPEYGGGGGGGDAGGGGDGWLGGPLAWVAGAWGAIKAAAQQHTLQRHLRTYLRMSGGRAALLAAAAHMQLLLAATSVAVAGGDAATAAAVAAAAGPELLGISAAEARRMDGAEWGELVAAAAATAAEAELSPTARLSSAALLADADEALAAAAAGGSIGSGGPAGADAEAAYLAELAAALVAARSLVQHSAVALFVMPAGPGRRHLQHLSSSLQRRLEQLEPLLLALPEREALPPPPQQQQQQQQQQGGRRQGGRKPGGGGGGPFAWLLQRWYGVNVAPRAATGSSLHPTLAALPAEALLQQAQFAAAVHQQRGAVQAALRGLLSDMRELREAARAGAYA